MILLYNNGAWKSIPKLKGGILMVLKRFRIQVTAIFLGAFMAFSGSYAFRLLIEKYVALPGGVYRVITITAFAVLFIISSRSSFKIGEKCFLWFSFFYFIRLLIEGLSYSWYYISPFMVFVHFIIGAFLPFIFITKSRLDSRHFNVVLNALLLSGLLFGVAAYLAYGDFVGQVSRLTSNRLDEDDAIGPLLLSYVSSMTLGIAITYWIYNKLSMLKIVYVCIVICALLIPFFLGASRGAVIALIFPFIIIFLSKAKLENSLSFILLLGVILYIGITVSEYLGSGIIDRFISIQSDVESGGGGNERISMWRQGLSQFYDNPLFGDGLRLDGYEIYPHNLFIETLLTTGVIGCFFMVMLMILAFKKAVYIFKHHSKFSWIGVLFIQCFVQSMFSFSIYSNKWIWISIALLFAFNGQQRKPMKVRSLSVEKNKLIPSDTVTLS